METYLELRSADVVHETIEDETIVIDLQTGAYYWAAGLSSVVFLQALSGLTRNDLLEWVAATYPDQASATEDTKLFLDALVAVNLCVISQDVPVNPVTLMPVPPEKYSTPVIGGSDDMAELLLLDPIHEVDPDAGWPTSNTNT